MKPTVEDRFWAKVDKNGPLSPRDNTPCWLWTGCVLKHPARKHDGCGLFSNGFKLVMAPRYAYELLVASIPPDLTIDHRYTCSKRCVNPDHLRLATNKQQSENRDLLSSNTSGVSGVSWQKDHKKWRARVRHYGKRIDVGYFADLEDAKAAVIAKRNELFTHNDPDRIGSP